MNVFVIFVEAVNFYYKPEFTHFIRILVYLNFFFKKKANKKHNIRFYLERKSFPEDPATLFLHDVTPTRKSTHFALPRG